MSPKSSLIWLLPLIFVIATVNGNLSVKKPQYCTLWSKPSVNVVVERMYNNINSVMKIGTIIISDIRFKIDKVINNGKFIIEVHKDGMYMGNIERDLMEVMDGGLPLQPGTHKIRINQPLENIILGKLNIKVKVLSNGRLILCLMDQIKVIR